MRSRLFASPIVLVCLAVLLAACKLRAPSTQPPTLRPTLSSTASASPTVTLTPTRRPTRTRTPRPTPTRDLSPQKASRTLGKGLANDVVRSADGKLAAILENGGTENSRLRWLDAATGEELGAVKPGAVYGLVGFSKDNRWLLAESIFGAYVIDTASGAVQNCCGGGNGPGFGFRFSADGHYLSYTGADSTTGGPYHFVGVFAPDPAYNFELPTPTPSAIEWDYNQAYPVLNPDNYHTMSPAAISPNDRWLAAGYHDSGNNLLYVWELKTAAVQYAIPHIAEINSVDFSPDGRFLASGGEDGVLRLFRVSTGQLQRTLTGFTDSITRLRFSADGRQIMVRVNGQPDQVVDLASGEIQPWDTPESTPDPLLVALHQQGYTDGSSVLFSPDGMTLAIGGDSLQLWDLSTQEVRLSIEKVNEDTAIGWAFSPDSHRLAQIYDAGDIVVWDVETGKVLLNLTSQILAAGQVFYAAGGGIGPGIGAGVFTGQGIAFSPDSRQIAFGNGNGIEIWDIDSATPVMRLTQPAAPAYATRVSFSADGRRLYAVINRNRGAQIWDAGNGTLLKELDLPPVDPNAFSATALNGSLFARNNYADSVYWIELWDLESGKMFKLPSRARETEPLRFSPDGSLLIALTNGRLFFWRTDTGALVDWMHLDIGMPGLAISPDNATLAIGNDGQAQLWDIAALRAAASQADFTPVAMPPTATPWSNYPASTPEPTAPFILPALPTLPAGAISAGNALHLIETGHFGRGRLVELSWGEAPFTLLTASPQGVFAFGGTPLAEMAHWPVEMEVMSLAQTPDGDILAAGVNGRNVQVWNLSTRTRLAELPGSGPLRLHPAGHLLVYGDDDGNLHSYDLAAQQPLATLYSLYQSQLPVFSPDGRLVAAVNGYETRLGTQHFVRIWDTYSGKIVNAVGGLDAAISDLSFSADGKFVVGAAGGSAWMWEVRPAAGHLLQIELYPSEHDGNLTLYHQRVTAVAISPDGRRLAVGDSERNIGLYEVSSRRLMRSLPGHAAPLDALRFSPDGTRLLSADADGQVILWEASGGKKLEGLAAHTGEIRGMTLGLDGNLRAWANNTAWTLAPHDGELLHTTSVYSGTIFAASPDGDWLAVSNRLHMSLWDATSGAFGQLLEGEAGDPFIEHMWEGIVLRGYYRAFFNIDGSRLTTEAPGETWVYEVDSARQFQQVSYQPGSTYQILDETANPIAVSPGGGMTLAAAQYWEDYPGLVLSNPAGQEIRRLELGESAWVTALAFSPDARLAVLGQEDGSLALLDIVAWKVVCTYPAHRGAVTALVFSADGRTLVSAGEDGSVRFWGLGE